MMKRPDINASCGLRLLFCIALLCGMASCANEGAEDLQVPMTLSASFGEDTRADATQIPLDGEKYTLYSRIYYLPDGATSPSNYSTSAFQKFTYSAETNRYTCPLYYPLSGKMIFTAYAANTTAAISTTSSVSGNYLTKLVFNLTDGDGLTEVIYSDVSKVDCPPASPATLHFHRAQANLRFKFTPADEYTCKHVIINSIEVKDVQWKGKINVTYNSSTGKATHSWSGLKAKSNLTYQIVSKGIIPAEDSPLRMRWKTSTGQPIPLESGDGLHIYPTTTGRTQIIITYTMLNDPTTVAAGGVGGAVDQTLLGREDDYVRYLTFVIDAEPEENWEVATQYYYNIKVHGNSQMDVEKVSVKTVENGPTGTMEI